MSQTPPPQLPGHVSLSDINRFVQQGGVERVAGEVVQASKNAIANARAAHKRWVAGGGLERVSRNFDAVGSQIKAGADFSKTNAKWGYLANRIGGAAGLILIFALAGRDSVHRADASTHEQRRLARLSDAAVAPFIAQYLADAQVLSELDDHLKKASLWSSSERQISKGLGHIGDGDYELACPLLFTGLEGAFWKVAREEGLAAPMKPDDRKMVFARGRSEGNEIKGLGQLVDGFRGEGLIDADLCAYIKELVYGGPGNPYRHGNAEEGWQERGLLLVGAVAGWLEHYGDPADKNLLRDAIARCQERLEADEAARRGEREARRRSEVSRAA